MKKVKKSVSDWVVANKGIFGLGIKIKPNSIYGFDNHHALRDTKGNRKHFPKLIHSVINIYVIEHAFHIDHHGACPKMTDLEASAWELWLEQNTDIAKFINDPIAELPGARMNELMFRMKEHNRLNWRIEL